MTRHGSRPTDPTATVPRGTSGFALTFAEARPTPTKMRQAVFERPQLPLRNRQPACGFVRKSKAYITARRCPKSKSP